MNKIIDLVLKKTKRRLKLNKLTSNKNINSDILKIKKELEFFLNKI